MTSDGFRKILGVNFGAFEINVFLMIRKMKAGEKKGHNIG